MACTNSSHEVGGIAGVSIRRGRAGGGIALGEAVAHRIEVVALGLAVPVVTDVVLLDIFALFVIFDSSD